jgi:hypothetical protein
MITKGSSRIHLTEIRKRLSDFLKAEKAKGTVRQGESRKGRSGMDKDMAQPIKGNPTKKVRAVNMLAKEQRSAASGFSLKPELKLSSADVEAVKHNPKVAGKEEGRLAQGQGCGEEVGFSKKTTSTPKAKGIFWILLSQVPTKYLMVPVMFYMGNIRRRLWKKCRNSKGWIIKIPKKLLLKNQLRASTPEAMSKIVLQVTSHQSYTEFFQNLDEGDEFGVDR